MNYTISVSPKIFLTLLSQVPSGTVGVMVEGPVGYVGHRVLMHRDTLISLDDGTYWSRNGGKYGERDIYVRPLNHGETITLTGK